MVWDITAGILFLSEKLFLLIIPKFNISVPQRDYFGEPETYCFIIFICAEELLPVKRNI